MANKIYISDTFKDFLLVALSILVIVLIFRACHLEKRVAIAESRVLNAPDSLIKAVIRPDSVWLDSTGKAYAVITPNNTESKTEITNKYYSIDYDKPFIDSVRQALDLETARKAAQAITVPVPVQQVQYVDTSKYIRTIDSLRNQVTNLSYSNDFLSFNNAGVIPTTDSTGTVQPPKYRYSAKIVTKQEAERNKIAGAPIGRLTRYIYISSLDTNATINGQRTYMEKIDEPAYGLRVQAGLSFNPVLPSWSFGPGMRLDLWRFSLGAFYYYNTQRLTWNPIINVSYDIKR